MAPSPVTNALFSAVHLLGVVLAFSSVFLRARALARVGADDAALSAALRADNVWGISALLLVGTGLARLLWLEKGWEFYSHGPFFHAKMTLVGLVFVLEGWPMVTLVLLRVRERRDGLSLDARRASLFSRISYAQAALLFGVLFCAPMMARGVAQLG